MNIDDQLKLRKLRQQQKQQEFREQLRRKQQQGQQTSAVGFKGKGFCLILTKDIQIMFLNVWRNKFSFAYRKILRCRSQSEKARQMSVTDLFEEKKIASNFA